MFSQKKSALILTVLAVVLAVSLFANLYHPSFTEAQPVNMLSVSISGPEKIPFNQTTTYTASVDGSTFGKLTYSWSISPDDGKTVIVESGDSCTLTYIQPTTDPYTLKVEVRDEAHGFGVGVKTVMDPATFPNLYLGVYGAPYSYMVCVDESGAYYYAINGKTGRVEWSSTNGATVVQNSINALTSGFGKVSIAGDINLGTTGITLPENNNPDSYEHFTLECIGDATLTYTGSESAITASYSHQAELKVNLNLNNIGNTGITLDKSRFVKIQSPHIKNFANIGLLFTGVSGTNESLWNEVYSPHIVSTVVGSIGTQLENSANLNKFYGGVIKAQNTSVKIISALTTQFYGTDMSPISGIGLYVNSTGTILSGCWIEMGSGTRLIEMGSGANSIEIMGGDIDIDDIYNPYNGDINFIGGYSVTSGYAQLAAGATSYIPFGGFNSQAAEGDCYMPIGKDAYAARINIKVGRNTCDGNTTVTFRQNALDTLISVTIMNGTTGSFTDLENNYVVLTKGDALAYKVVRGGSTGVISVCITIDIIPITR